MITHTPPLADYLPTKSLVARQQPTSGVMFMHTHTHTHSKCSIVSHCYSSVEVSCMWKCIVFILLKYSQIKKLGDGTVNVN